MIRPLKSYTRISTKFAQQPDPGHFGKHLGIDYATPVGTPVFAPCHGVITQVSTGASGGKTIEMRGAGHLRRFLHLSRQDVNVGMEVREGQQIGLSGASGHVTGPHLHYDVRRDGTTWSASFANYIDPEAELVEANKPKPAPAIGKNIGKRIHLSKRVSEWAFYRPGTPLPVRRENRAGELSPKKWGGLTYTIVGNPALNTYEVISPSLGRIWIYADEDATIS